jgi:hypothetical protein
MVSLKRQVDIMSTLPKTDDTLVIPLIADTFSTTTLEWPPVSEIDALSHTDAKEVWKTNIIHR